LAKSTTGEEIIYENELLRRIFDSRTDEGAVVVGNCI
jgi:hypothetical protein